MSRNRIIVLLLSLSLVAAGAFFYNKYRIAPEISFSSLQLEDLDGKPVNLQSFDDKNLLLNFFATWCGPCIRELPGLEKTAEILGGNNYLILCISDEPLGKLRRFSENLGLHIRILHSIKPFSVLKISTYPTSYALNLKRAVIFKKVGNVDWTDEQVIETLKKGAH